MHFYREQPADRVTVVISQTMVAAICFELPLSPSLIIPDEVDNGESETGRSVRYSSML
ncbi:hypothetical protein NLM27_27030 [Bradyrhizobium sp. CCGB12]|uniref:hypothetical protein n=1 Tax=Bradyrhizobium sp. CCGB12 TaxID=2949632 RepID=UPI0020B1F7CC|nr:hypothetical protein [Bradyrhizobium sp. CCGB12]MCP3392404.1 hypothetical protein [Bradyrhizobium sp. CCGB12]